MHTYIHTYITVSCIMYITVSCIMYICVYKYNIVLSQIRSDQVIGYVFRLSHVRSGPASGVFRLVRLAMLVLLWRREIDREAAS